MEKQKIAVSFANDSKLILTSETVLYPIKVAGSLQEDSPLVLRDSYSPVNGYIEELTSFFSRNEFFTVDEEGLVDVTIYKTSAVVSFKEYDSNLTKSSLFKK